MAHHGGGGGGGGGAATGFFQEDEILGKAYDARLMRRLLGYLRTYRSLVIVALVILLGLFFADVAPPVIAKFIIDNAIDPAVSGQIPLEEGFARLAPCGALYIAGILALSLVRYAQSMLAF